MNIKKILGAGILGAMVGASKGAKKGLDVGMKIGFSLGVTTVVLGTSILILGKKKLEKKMK